MRDHLFVYGTLAPGESNEWVLSGIPGQWQPASIRGRRHPLGWGKTGGYPGLLIDAAADRVEGWLFTSKALSAHWGLIDRFEGDRYRRVGAEVSLADGSTVVAQVYVVKALQRR